MSLLEDMLDLTITHLFILFCIICPFCSSGFIFGCHCIELLFGLLHVSLEQLTFCFPAYVGPEGEDMPTVPVKPGATVNAQTLVTWQENQKLTTRGNRRDYPVTKQRTSPRWMEKLPSRNLPENKSHITSVLLFGFSSQKEEKVKRA